MWFLLQNHPLGLWVTTSGALDHVKETFCKRPFNRATLNS